MHPEAVYLGIVHRLDRPTSGVLIWAKTPRAARRLSAQFERRRVVKEYWALVDAGPIRGDRRRDFEPEAAIRSAGGEDTWCDWLTQDRPDRPGPPGPARDAGARRAVTRVRREPAELLPAGVAWLRLWPETGRTHQLRAQAAARGMPILGDSEYGSTTPFGPPHAIALHARSLQVRHPTLQTPLTLVRARPARMASLRLRSRRWRLTSDRGPAADRRRVTPG